MPSSGVQTCALDRKSTRLNSSHTIISYAVFCLKKKYTLSDLLLLPTDRNCSLFHSERGGASYFGRRSFVWAWRMRGRVGAVLGLSVFFKRTGPPRILLSRPTALSCD